MAQVIIFPQKAQPVRTAYCPALPECDIGSAMRRVICEFVIFGCFLFGLVMMIYAFGGALQ